MPNDKEIALATSNHPVMALEGLQGRAIATDCDITILQNIIEINSRIAQKIIELKAAPEQTPVSEHDCWRCMPDDEEPITFAWIEWAGFRKVRWKFYLDNFSVGPQIDFKWNGFWMQTTHNMAPMTKRWEVRSLLAVHHDKLVAVGHGKIWEVAPKFEEKL